MKYITLWFCLAISSFAFVCPASAEETLDTLLPPPGWLRRNAQELGVDADTRTRLENIYEEKEPKYHQLKYEVERLTGQLYPILKADDLDEGAIQTHMKKLLQAENELKLYQVHVRISLLSELSPDEISAVRVHARKNSQQIVANTNWKGKLTVKIERIRELSQQAESRAALLKKTKAQMKNADKAFADGDVVNGNRILDEVIRVFEAAER